MRWNNGQIAVELDYSVLNEPTKLLLRLHDAESRLAIQTARADELQARVDELMRPTQYHDVGEFYKDEPEDKP